MSARTMEGLSPAELEHYWEQGFVLKPKLIRQELLYRLDARFETLVAEPAERPPEMTVMRDVMVVKGAVAPQSELHAVNKLMSFEEDAELYDYVKDSWLLTCVRQLIGQHLFTLSTNVFNKPPGVDGKHPLHQDLRYFRIRPADKIVATWTALRPATRESGCLAVVPGSHRGPLLEHGDPDWDFVNRGFFAAKDAARLERLHVEMAPGDTLLFHPLLIHGSGRNRGNDFRRAISAHYASDQCRSEDRDWREWKAGKRVREVRDA